MTATVVSVLLVIFGGVVINECSEIAPWLATRVLRWSARRLRAQEKIERYSEEWLADLERVPGKVTKLLWALQVAILGVAGLRSPRHRLDWQPGPIVNPFSSDSLFGPGNPGLAILQSRRRFVTALLARPPAPTTPGHQCGGLCGVDCASASGSRTTAVATIDGQGAIADSVELVGRVNYAFLLQRNDRGYSPPAPSGRRYRISGELFNDLEPAYALDFEHKRPAYLVEHDPEDVFGTDEITAPPVIGDDEPYRAPARRFTDWPSSGPGFGELGVLQPGDVRGLFDAAMRLMRSDQPAKRESGFQMIKPIAPALVMQLIEVFGAEADQRMRCRLLELIGEARSPLALTVLATQLRSDDETLRNWAAHGLELLDTPEARKRLKSRCAA